ncbi:MAG: riboflavin synthase [Myxococcota bacterium]|nr:riboflavin synthase [Myxococcota bacterium]
MFTGIVEEIGRVAAIEKRDALVRLTTEGAVVQHRAQIGDSIAVNGVCLTVVAIEDARLSFEAVPETLRRTNLGQLEVGSPVNLERAATAERPMGGHYVQGHVDATITVRAVAPDGDAREMWFDAPEALLKYVVPKGYVTVDGASLTVVETDAAGFSVTLVPHTQDHVVFGAASPGYVANFEVDVMAKYVERVVGPRLDALERRLAALGG